LWPGNVMLSHKPHEGTRAAAAVWNENIAWNGKLTNTWSADGCIPYKNNSA